MKFAVVCMFGCAMVSPFHCGESWQPAETKKTSAPADAKPGEGTAKAKSKQPPVHTDPLVPAIDIGDASSMSTDSGLPTIASVYDFSSGERAIFHAHGKQVCASGCAASRHPTGMLTQAKYHWLLRRFAEQPMNETSPALESLMYFGRQTVQWMQKEGTGKLGAARIELLRKELRHTHAIVQFRVVDEYGVARVSIPPTRVPLDRRHVFKMNTKDLPPLITSGTVKRVGLHHLWTRL